MENKTSFKSIMYVQPKSNICTDIRENGTQKMYKNRLTENETQFPASPDLLLTLTFQNHLPMNNSVQDKLYPSGVEIKVISCGMKNSALFGTAPTWSGSADMLHNSYEGFSRT